VDIIIDHTENLMELINNIVDLSRIQTNQLYLKKVRFDPNKMFLALLDKFRIKLKREKKSFIDLKLDMPENKDYRLNLDYNRFWKIVYQLIDNSIKYTENGYIQFGYSKKENGILEVYVKDTGVGIKKEKLAVVFDSFRKVEKESAKLQPGIGLGLSLVKGLVTLMGGTIQMESSSIDEDAGNQPGTSVRIEIPNAFVENA
jgi:signal transduction histidine kinase